MSGSNDEYIPADESFDAAVPEMNGELHVVEMAHGLYSGISDKDQCLIAAGVIANWCDYDPKLRHGISDLIKSPEIISCLEARMMMQSVKQLNSEEKQIYQLAVEKSIDGKMDPDRLRALFFELFEQPPTIGMCEDMAQGLIEAHKVEQIVKSLKGKIEEIKECPKLVGTHLKTLISGATYLEKLGGEKKGKLPDLIDSSKFLSDPIDEPKQVIHGILHRGSKLAFGGSSKSFKTWNLLDLAISVHAGAKWLGHQTTQGKVLFVNCEIQNYPWQKRIEAVARAKGVQMIPGMFKILNLRGHRVDYRHFFPKIIEVAKDDDYSLAIFDPIYKLYGKGMDENSTGGIADILGEVEWFTNEVNAAAAFGAHFAKGNASQKEAIDRMSGSGVFARDPDAILPFTAHDEEGCFVVEPILRNFAAIPPFTVRWQYPLMIRADDLDPTKLKQSAGRKKQRDPMEILNAIRHTTKEHPVSLRSWAELAAVERTSLTDTYLPDLVRLGVVTTSGEGNKAGRYITAKGVGVLAKWEDSKQKESNNGQ